MVEIGLAIVLLRQDVEGGVLIHLVAKAAYPRSHQNRNWIGKVAASKRVLDFYIDSTGSAIL